MPVFANRQFFVFFDPLAAFYLFGKWPGGLLLLNTF